MTFSLGKGRNERPYTQFKYILTGIIANATETITEKPMPTLFIKLK
jgi:hypothetical protein